VKCGVEKGAEADKRGYSSQAPVVWPINDRKSVSEPEKGLNFNVIEKPQT
jgi:hypothetical protein